MAGAVALSDLPDSVPVDWATYRLWCERPDVCPRFLLEATSALLRTQGETVLADRLRRQCESPPLRKPPDHRGDARSDCFAHDLTASELRAVVAFVRGCRSRGERLADGRDLGGVVEAWDERLRPLPSPPPGGALRLQP